MHIIRPEWTCITKAVFPNETHFIQMDNLLESVEVRRAYQIESQTSDIEDAVQELLEGQGLDSQHGDDQVAVGADDDLFGETLGEGTSSNKLLEVKGKGKGKERVKGERKGKEKEPRKEKEKEHRKEKEKVPAPKISDEDAAIDRAQTKIMVCFAPQTSPYHYITLSH